MRRSLVKQKTVAATVLRGFSEVPIERAVLRRSLSKSFHKRGPAIQNDRWPNVPLHRGMCAALLSKPIHFLCQNPLNTIHWP